MTHGGQRRAGRVALSAAIFFAFVACLLSARPAGAGTLTLAWDRSSDAAVIGYRVYVGTYPGIWSQMFDVGSATSFVYQAPETRLYYMAVAAYSAGPAIGALSAVVSGYPTGSSSAPVSPSTPTFPDAQSYYSYLWQQSSAATQAVAGLSAGTPRRPLNSSTCWSGREDCVVVKTVARLSARATSLAATSDGRVFYVEGGRRLGMAIGNSRAASSVLIEAAQTITMGQVAIDPSFAATGAIYVSEIETYAGGRRDFRIVRYRVVRNRAVGRVVVLGIPLRGSGQALFALASTGHIYVAMPDDPNAQSAADDAGTVSRFNIDGTLPDHGSEPPVIAAGYAHPTAISYDEGMRRLWLAGADMDWSAVIGTLAADDSWAPERRASLRSTSLGVQMQSLATVIDSNGRTELFAVSAEGRFEKTEPAADGSIVEGVQLTTPTGTPIAVTTAGGNLFLSVANDLSTADGGSTIIQLQPTR